MLRKDCDFDMIGLYFLCVYLTIGIRLSLILGTQQSPTKIYIVYYWRKMKERELYI